jgi:enoyl-CoA hydratase
MNEALVLNERNAVLEVTFNRAEKYNAISDAMLEALHKAVGRFERRPDLRVMLIRAEGKYFSSGADLNPDAVPDFGGSTLDGRAWYRQKFHTLFDEIESIEKPLVVAHQGPCLGGALELSLSCDFRLAAASAHYALPEIKIGAMPSSGGVSRLTRIVGPHWTRWLVMTGERVTAQQAVQMGIVHAVYPDEVFQDRVQVFCARLARQPYETLGLAKLSIELATDLDRAQARNAERIANSILFTGDEDR